MGLFSSIFRVFFGGGPNTDRTINIGKQSAVAGLAIIYGRQRVEPVPVFKDVSRDNMPVASNNHDLFMAPQSSAFDEQRKNNDWLYRVDCWGQGEITAIEKFWLNGDPSTASRFAKRAYFRSHSFYGSASQLALPELAGISKWTTAHRGLGVAYSVNRFYSSKKKPQFRSEPTVEALIKGLKLYDPRKDETNPDAWNGVDTGHRFNDPSTWTWTQNKVLVALDYLTAGYGQGAAYDEVDWASWALEADHCETETIDVPDVLTNTTGVTIENYYDFITGEFRDVLNGERLPNYRPSQAQGTNTLTRYTTDAQIDPKQPVVDNMKVLLEGFGWSMPWSNGRHKLIVEKEVDGSVMSFDEDSIIGGWTITRGQRKKRLNRVTVEFENANKEYEKDAASWPPLDSIQYATYLAEDQGEELHTRREVDTISDHYQAQAYAEYLVRKSRVDQDIKGLKLAPKAMVLEPGDVIALSNTARGYNGTRFIVEKVTISEALDVTVDLLLYDGTVYGAAVVQEPENMPVSSPNPWLDPDPIANLAATPFHDVNADGTAVSGFLLTWDAPESTTGLEYVEVAWREQDPTDTAPYVNLNRIALDAVSTRLAGLKDDQAYDIRITYRTALGQTADDATITAALGNANTNLLALSGGEIIANPWFRFGLRDWLASSGFFADTFTWPDARGQEFALRHDPVNDQDEYRADKADAHEYGSRFVSKRPFRTHEQEIISLAVYGDTTGNADGELRLGIEYYAPGDIFLGEAISPDEKAVGPTDPFYSKSRIDFVTPSGAAYAKVFVLITGHNTGTWYVTGINNDRNGTSDSISALNLTDAPDGPGATKGATIGTNTYDPDGLVVDGNDIITADGQVVIPRGWDFDNSLQGWGGTNVTLTPLPNRLRVDTTAADPQLESPADLNIDGARNNIIQIRMRRAGGPVENSFEWLQLFYKTDSHDYSSAYSAVASRQIKAGYQTFVFDMSNLKSGGDDWLNSTIKQIRLDPSVSGGDSLEIDRIGIGHVSAAAADFADANLVDELGMVETALVDDGSQTIVGAKDIDRMGLQVGKNVSVGLEILGQGTRSGRLIVRFLDSGGGTISEEQSGFVIADATYQQAVILGETIPAGTTRMQFVLDREDAGAGGVTARRLTMNLGSTHKSWRSVRDDVEQNANNTTDTNQLNDGAGLGTTALWPNVTGANKPADNATRNTGALADLNFTNIDHIVANAANLVDEQLLAFPNYIFASEVNLIVQVFPSVTSTEKTIPGPSFGFKGYVRDYSGAGGNVRFWVDRAYSAQAVIDGLGVTLWEKEISYGSDPFPLVIEGPDPVPFNGSIFYGLFMEPVLVQASAEFQNINTRFWQRRS